MIRDHGPLPSEEVKESTTTRAAQARWRRILALEMYPNLAATVRAGPLGGAILSLIVFELPTEIVPDSQHHIPLKILDEGKSPCLLWITFLKAAQIIKKQIWGKWWAFKLGHLLLLLFLL